MAKKRRHYQKQKNAQHFGTRPAAAAAPVREAYEIPQRKARVEYGKPFILLEDANKDTFEFKAGQWARHTSTIAECRESCLVKQLPQKLNGMTRYEIRYPIPGDE